MSLLFAWPLGLLALFALAIPLLLHLARRSEYPPRPFAALRWLGQRLRPRRRVRFDEWLLLVVRLILLAVLALLLARPLLQGGPLDTRSLVAVVPGLDVERAQAVPGLPTDARWVWLAPGFPDLQDAPAADTTSSPSSLLRELDQQLPADAALTVLLPGVLDRLDGEVPRLSRTVQWHVIEGAGTSAAGSTQQPPAAPALWVYADASHQPQLRWGRALQLAWQERAAPTHAADASAPMPADDAVALWLASTAPPTALLEWVARGGRLMVSHDAPVETTAWADALTTDEGARVLQRARHGRGSLLRWTVALDAEHLPMLLQPELPAQLLRVLQPAPEARRAPAATHVPDTGLPAWAPAARDVSSWLLLLAALLFLVERWLASGRRRGAAA